LVNSDQKNTKNRSKVTRNLDYSILVVTFTEKKGNRKLKELIKLKTDQLKNKKNKDKKVYTIKNYWENCKKLKARKNWSN